MRDDKFQQSDKLFPSNKMKLLAEFLKNRTSSIEQVFVLSLIVIWITWLVSRRHLYIFSFQLPGPIGFPLLGSIYKIIRPKDIFPFLQETFSTYKSHTVATWFGMNPFLVTIDPDLIEKILSSQNFINKSKIMYQSVTNNFGENLITAPIPKWSEHRKIINPTFNHKVLKSFFPIFNKGANVILKKLEQLAGQGEKKLLDIVQRTSLTISMETTMGKELKEGISVDDFIVFSYQYSLKKMMEEILFSLANIGFLIKWNLKYKKIKRSMHAFVDSLVSQRLKFISKKDPDERFEELNDSITKKARIFIDQVYKNYQQKQLDWKELIDESNTMVFASFETTSNGIYSTIVMLAMHPDIQERLFEELEGVFPESDFEVNEDQLDQLRYLDMIINETLRVAPSVPIIGREGVTDAQLLDGSLVLPKGVPVLISIYNLHRHENIWGPNAHLFNPDNFLPENLAEKHPYAYIPFSKGVRNCIGWRYALMTIKVIVARMVRNYRFTTNFKYKDLRFVGNISMKYDVEPMLQVHRR